jgi:hypothetical protein
MRVGNILKSGVRSIASVMFVSGLAFVALTSIGVNAAHADKVCVSSDNQQVVKIGSNQSCGSFLKEASGAGMNDARWKSTSELSCEKFAKNKMAWASLTVCDDLRGPTSYMGDYWREWTVYPYSWEAISKPTDVVAGAKCAANSCSYGVTTSVTKSVTVGGTGTIGAFAAGLDIGISKGSGTTLSCSWLNGEIPGIKISNPGLFTDPSLIKYLRCYTKGIASDQANKQMTNTNDCTSTADIKIDGKTYKRGTLTKVGAKNTTYASAKQTYDNWYEPYKDRNSKVFVSGTKKYYVCNVNLLVSVPSGFRTTGYKWSATAARRALTLK